MNHTPISPVKIAITGASGMLGTALIEVLSNPYSVYACGRTQGLEKADVAWKLFDLNDRTSLESWLNLIQPEVVIHSAALTNVDACEEQREAAAALHEHIPLFICEKIKSWGAQFIYISSDAVFDGLKKEHYSEEDEARPLQVYGATKRKGEKAVLQYSNSLVIRTNIFGRNYLPRRSFAEWVLNGLQQSQPLSMFEDVFFTPIHVTHLSEIIEKLIRMEYTGLLHVAGNQALSKYDFSIKMSEIFGLSSEQIKPSRLEDVSLKALRPKNMSLSVAKLNTLGIYPPGALEGIQLLKQQYGA